MTVNLRHRGPDAEGYLHINTIQDSSRKAKKIEAHNITSNIALGHRRLAIIDLDNRSRQPMASSDGKLSITYNGEIYNYKEIRNTLIQLGYKFTTESDTEVLINAWQHWKSDCLNIIEGMFAFVIFDHENGTIHCARDAFGIKPFFYHKNKDSFVFSSELESLHEGLKRDKALNLQQTYDYLIWGKHDCSTNSLYQDVETLQPGHLLTIELKSTYQYTITRWWQPSIQENTDISFEEAANEVRSHFLKSLRFHMRSDVAIGAALSGGIDSSAIVCGMRELEPDLPIHTFTYSADSEAINEQKWADIVNKHVNAIQHTIQIDDRELAENLEGLIKAQGEPFRSTSIYAQYCVYKKIKETGITVSLDGQGADELFGGYNGYPQAKINGLIRQKKLSDLYSFIKSWSKGHGQNKKMVINHLIRSITPDFLLNAGYKAYGQNPAPSWLNKNYLENNGAQVSISNLQNLNKVAANRTLCHTLREALTNKGLQSLLRYGDRNSMRWSVESRFPFLCRELVEFSLTLPDRYLVSNKALTKTVFRTAMRGIVPDKVLDRSDKVGFNTPESQWLIQQSKKVEQWTDNLDALPFINTDACRSYIKSILDQNIKYDSSLWRIINLCIWSKQNNIKL